VWESNVAKVLTRYLRLFAYFVAFSFSRSFEFRFDFVMRILMDVVYYAVAISFFRIMFLHTDNLGGWNEAQMMIFVSGYIMVDAINMTLFSNNMFQFPNLVNRGDLDYYLIRPVSTLFFLSLRDFAANSFINVLITLGIFGWAVGRYPEPMSAARVVFFLLLILNGNLLFYCLNMLANLPVFFTHSGQGFGYLMWSINKFAERPDRIFTGWMRRILTLALPFSLIASFPTRLLLESLDYWLLIHILVVTAIFFSLLLWGWNVALRHYSSASS
jgi:ABC-2 type transport system permease protein